MFETVTFADGSSYQVPIAATSHSDAFNEE